MSKIILIVDDWKDNLTILSEFLKPQFELISKNNGKEAINFAEEDIFDLAIIDIQMPIIDGFTVMRKIKEMPAHQGIPIIGMCTYDGSEYVKKILEIADDFISKPINKEILVKKVNALLSSTEEEEEYLIRSTIGG